MALRKQVTKRDIINVANDDAKLDRMVEQFFKQDGYKLKNGAPQITYRTVTIRHRCVLCSLRWTEKRKVGSNVEINPDVVIRHESCNQCHIQLLNKSKCELALMVIELQNKGRYGAKERKGDITDIGYSVDPNAIVMGNK